MLGQLKNWLRTRPKPRLEFSLRRLMASVTLISLGFAAFTVAGRMQFNRHSFPAVAACWLVGVPLLGAGICAPFKFATEGAIVGFIMAASWTALIAFCIQYADV
jgi:hypothetical protein